MAFEENRQNISLPAGADLSSSQYKFVSIDSNGQVVVTGAGAQADGVNQNKPDAAGKVSTVTIAGVSKVECGGTVTAGFPVASDADGEAVDAATGDNISGVALEAGEDGQLISVLLKTQNANAIA